MNKYKYLLSFLFPVIIVLSIYNGGYFAYLPITFMFILVPVLELILDQHKYNLTPHEVSVIKGDIFFDVILYIHVLLYGGIFLYFLLTIEKFTNMYQFMAMVTGMGILNGACVINLAHEFCHRKGRINQYIAEFLLLMSLETHFRSYHIRCHHLRVATPHDPATARRGEWIYSFVFREQIGSYIQAWQAEKQVAQKKGYHPYLLKNRMVVYLILQLALLSGIYFFSGEKTLIAFFLSSIIGMFTLACASYVEHYGIIRQKNSNGKYEPVTHAHSWNADNPLTRIILFELSRHADHHYFPNKKYQLLDSKIESPQLFTGYPGSMLLAFIPPLWFKLMNPELDRVHKLDN